MNLSCIRVRTTAKMFRNMVLTALLTVVLAPNSVFAADKLIVKDTLGNTKFVVTDSGKVGMGTSTPQYDLDIVAPDKGQIRISDNATDTTTKGARMVLNHYTNAELPVYLFGAASTATDNFVAFGGGNAIGNAATQIDLFTGSTTTTQTGFSRMTVKGNGYIGFGTQSPAYPLHHSTGAYLSVGGVWTDASSREYKENISRLSADKALNALKALDPVEFTYKADKEERHTGFIAEDAPELVATKDRKGLSPMDIVAVLTKVVQEQQESIEMLSGKVDRLERELWLRGVQAKAERE